MIAVTNSRHLFPFIGKLCAYCHHVMTYAGKRRPTRDHVMPKCHGHGYTNNKVICCASCNNSKSHLHIVTWWSRLKNGNDPRAPIVFAFIVDRMNKGLLNTKRNVRMTPLSSFQSELKTWQRPAVVPEDHAVNIVTRIGPDEVATSLMATWH